MSCVRAYNKNARVHFIRKLIRLPHEVIISPRISIIACVHYKSPVKILIFGLLFRTHIKLVCFVREFMRSLHSLRSFYSLIRSLIHYVHTIIIFSRTCSFTLFIHFVCKYNIVCTIIPNSLIFAGFTRAHACTTFIVRINSPR